LILHRFGTEIARHSWKEVLLTDIDLVRFYAIKLLFPIHLSPFYSNPVIASPSIKICTTALFGAAIIALALWIGLRREPIVALAMSLILLPLLPVLVGVRIFRNGDLAHDRYLYLPSFGLCLLLGLLFKYFWSRAAGRRWLVASVAGLVLTTLLGLNLTQQRYYHDDETFYKRGLEIAPNNTLVAGFLGSYYFRQGKFDLGVQQFRHAYEVSPESPEASEAEPLLSKLSSDTKIAESRRAVLEVALGQTQIRLGKLPAAQATLEPLLTTNDNLRELHRTLGTLYEMEGRLYDASHEYEREYQVSGDLQAHRRAIFLAQRRVDKAERPSQTPSVSP
jgi:tetratricopeptide (TPR) repeat protein